MDEKTVAVTAVPVDALERLRSWARANGVSDNDSAVMRWAALQWLLHLESSSANGPVCLTCKPAVNGS